ncbi:MAG: pyruvate kinase, partial [Oscillospiraceae bacterium]
MNVARFNFSHGTHQDHLEKLNIVHKLRKELNLPVACLLDTKGPEIRLGHFKEGTVQLVKDREFVLTTRKILGDVNCASVSYKDLPKDLHKGIRVLLDDGLIELEVTKIGAEDVCCKVLNSGIISDNKGVNIPDAHLSMPYLSEKDLSDINFAVDQDFDFIAASFTRSAEDILQIRAVLEERGCNTIRIIAKIENSEGVNNIDEILKVCDGVMIARGDMGVEVPLEDVPVIQKMIIRKALAIGRHTITATQMLDSMTKNPRPTRAEATDVANAIYDGTSAIMLSGETAAGKYPIEALTTMSKIALRTESDINYRNRFYSLNHPHSTDITNAIAHATCTIAYDLQVKAIVTVTRSGQTARVISKFRPDIPILGCTTDTKVYNQLALAWGVEPIICQCKENTDVLFDHAIANSKKAGYLFDGDIAVITGGAPVGVPGTTNLLRVYVVGDILVSGKPVGTGSAIGTVCAAEDEEEALAKFSVGDVLVVPFTTAKLLPIMKKAAAIITEQEGLNSHAAIAGAALDKPVIVGAKGATAILKSGTTVWVDCDKGTVRNSVSPVY